MNPDLCESCGDLTHDYCPGCAVLVVGGDTVQDEEGQLWHGGCFEAVGLDAYPEGVSFAYAW